MMNYSKCRSCGARVIWARTEAGKKMPVDATPVRHGNIVLAVEKHDAENDPLAITFSEPLDDGNDRFVSHFATCPNAPEWRSKRAS